MAQNGWKSTKYQGVRYKLRRWPGKAKQGKVYFGRVGTKEHRLGAEWEGITPAEANRILAGLKTKKIVPAAQHKSRTFDAGFEKYSNFFDVKKDCLKKDLTGYRSTKSRWNKYIKEKFGHRRVDSLTPDEINDFQAELSATGLAPETRRHILKLLPLAADEFDHTLKIEYPAVNNQKVDMPESDDLYRAFVAHLIEKKHPVADMMMFAVFTGMRRGEIARLQWADLDLNNNLLYIGQQKNGSRNHITLIPYAKDVLDRQPQSKSTYVFPGPSGGQRHLDSLTKTARRICDAFGMPPEHRPFHALRHWFATILASTGKVDQFTLQQLLRHKDPQMTARYSHLTNGAFDRVRQISMEAF